MSPLLLGVGEIIGIDPDVADETNRGRMAGQWWIDVLLKRKKTKVMARLAWLINRSVCFTEVPYAIPEQKALDAIKRADVIVGCVDSLHARSDLQAISWRYLIPYIDIGARIQLEPVPKQKQEPRVRAIGGNVQTLIPGGFCMWCADFLSQVKLDAETGGRSRSYFDKGAAQAQVVSSTRYSRDRLRVRSCNWSQDSRRMMIGRYSRSITGSMARLKDGRS